MVIFFLFLAPGILIVEFSNILSWEITFHFVLRCLRIFLSFYSAFPRNIKYKENTQICFIKMMLNSHLK